MQDMSEMLPDSIVILGFSFFTGVKLIGDFLRQSSSRF